MKTIPFCIFTVHEQREWNTARVEIGNFIYRSSRYELDEKKLATKSI